jgi:2-polyprenyl-3-methyl-5-hydroxy-6-metoxy-1,4-benzoquinol methylase
MYRQVDSCRCCGNSVALPFLDLGSQPLANGFHHPGSEPQAFPLAVGVCPNCFHAQLTGVVSAELLFTDYPYVSGTTTTLRTYFRWFAESVTAATGPGRVLEIGCNDGSQLAQFAALGWQTAGVDPAANLAVHASKHGAIHVGFWDRDALAGLGSERFDVILAQNVLGHVDDCAGFLQCAREALAPGGRIFIQTSQAQMVESGQFDTLYHEHVSFFSMASMRMLASRVGLSVAGVRLVSVHGGSYLFELAGEESSEPWLCARDSVARQLAEEREAGRYHLETYRGFGARANDVMQRTVALVADHRKRGYRAIGYGAAAKGNTFLNACGLQLDYIVDDNPNKHGLLSPGSGIPVVSPDVLRDEERPLTVLVLAWNFFEEVKRRIQILRPHSAGRDWLIRYFPSIESERVSTP